MSKIITAGLIGGIILWVWGFIAWVVLPLHQTTLRPIPQEAEVVNSLRGSLPEAGAYQFPAMPGEDEGVTQEARDAAMDEYMQRYRSGPLGVIFYDPVGRDPFMLSQMIIGLIIFIIAAGIVAWFLSRSTAAAEGFISRVVYCGMIGVLIAIGTHLSSWNWMGLPGDWTTAQMIDSVVGWLLAGAGIAAIIKPKLKTAA
jgi:hypothetical protein